MNSDTTERIQQIIINGIDEDFPDYAPSVSISARAKVSDTASGINMSRMRTYTVSERFGGSILRHNRL